MADRWGEANSGEARADTVLTIVHPAASAAPAFRVIIATGKFQGVMAAQTPTGCFKTCLTPNSWVSRVGIVALQGASQSSLRYDIKIQVKGVYLYSF